MQLEPRPDRAEGTEESTGHPRGEWGAIVHGARAGYWLAGGGEGEGRARPPTTGWVIFVCECANLLFLLFTESRRRSSSRPVSLYLAHHHHHHHRAGIFSLSLVISGLLRPRFSFPSPPHSFACLFSWSAKIDSSPIDELHARRRYYSTNYYPANDRQMINFFLLAPPPPPHCPKLCESIRGRARASTSQRASEQNKVTT